MIPYLDLAYQEGVFRRLTTELRADILSDIDPRVRAASPGAMKWIVCGTTMPVELAWLTRHLDVVAYVDDRRVGQEVAARPVISTQDWIELVGASREITSIIAVDTAHAYDHFARVAACFGLACLNVLQLEKLLRTTGCEALPAHFNIEFLDDVLRSSDRLERVAGLFADPFSRLTLFSILNHRLTRNPAFLSSVTGGRTPAYRWEDSERTDGELFGYFAYQLDRAFIRLGDDEVLVDGGAFDGVSVMQLARATRGRFRRIDAYEPEPGFLAKCRAATERVVQQFGAAVGSKIRLIGKGLWSEQATLEFQDDFHASAEFRDEFWSPMGAHCLEPTERSGAGTVQVTAIDDESPDATFIKLEIEGSELRALQGARKTITANRPSLAIAAYHKAGDLHELPEYVASLGVPYELGLRHHNAASFISTVIYCRPDDGRA